MYPKGINDEQIYSLQLITFSNVDIIILIITNVVTDVLEKCKLDSYSCNKLKKMIWLNYYNTVPKY